MADTFNYNSIITSPLADQDEQTANAFEACAQFIACAVLRRAVFGRATSKTVEYKKGEARKVAQNGSGWLYLLRAYNGITFDRFFGLKNDITQNISDGYDFVTEAKLALIEALARTKKSEFALGDTLDEKNEKTGEPLTLFKYAARAVNRAITRERRMHVRNKTLEVFDEKNAEYYEIPKNFEIESARELRLIEAADKLVQKSKIEQAIYNGRMCGLSLADIAKKTGSTYDTIRGVASRLRKKYIKAGISLDALREGGGILKALADCYD